MKRLFLVALLISALTLNASAYLNYKQRLHLSDSLEEVLARTKTAKDSVRILFNIVDLSSYARTFPNAERLYRAAISARDTSARLEALRIMANKSLANDSLLSIQQHRAELLPLSPEQRETVTFIRLLRETHAAHYLNSEERFDHLHDVLQEFDKDEKVDAHRRIEMLFTICLNLQYLPNNQLLTRYLEELEAIIERQPSATGALRSTFYNTSSMVNSTSGNAEDAIDADRKLLKLLDEQKLRYAAKGRLYRDYTIHRYHANQRMLGNYAALTPEEIEQCYRNLMDLAKANPDVEHDMKRLGITEAYYAMAKGHYAQAVPLLQKALAEKGNQTRRYRLLKLLIKAAQASGNGVALLNAYQQYVPLLEERASSINADRIIEHQVLLDINALEASKANLESINETMLRTSQRWRVVIFIVIAVILGVVLIWMYLSARRVRRSAVSLRKANRQLLDERDNLRKAQADLVAARDKARVAERVKTDFINTVGHEITEPVNAILGYSQILADSADSRLRPSMEKFIQIIDLNSQLLRTIVNDVLDVAELENSTLVLKTKRVAMNSLADTVAEAFRNRLQPGVSLTVKPIAPDDADRTIDTDPARALQVLNNMVSNAVKFTEKGSVTISYGLAPDSGIPCFVVEDTGPGVPADLHEAIFTRFFKISSVSQGIGLGLHICRLMSKMLGGSVVIDPDYTDGARFVFYLPQSETHEIIADTPAIK